MATYSIFRAIANYRFPANTPKLTADIITDYPTVNAMRIKTEGTRANVNNTIFVSATFNNETMIHTGDTYTFDKDCDVILGKYETVT